jgi:hypothetical protein
LAQIIEHRRSTIEQSATVGSRLDALEAAVKQRYTDRSFQLCDGPGNGGLSGVEARGCFPHTACLRDFHQDMKVLQLHAPSDAIAQLHP